MPVRTKAVYQAECSRCHKVCNLVLNYQTSSLPNNWMAIKIPTQIVNRENGNSYFIMNDWDICDTCIEELRQFFINPELPAAPRSSRRLSSADKSIVIFEE